MAKFNLLGLTTAAAFVVAGMVAAPVSDAQAREVLVVDSNKLWNDTKAGKDVQAQLREFSQNIEKQLKDAGEKMKKEAEDLKKQQEAKKIKEDEYKQKVGAMQVQLQNGVQQGRAVVQLASQRAKKQFYDAIRKHLEGVAKKKKGAVLIERSQIIYANAAVDVTAEAIKSIESNLKELKVELLPPQKEGEKAADAKAKKN